MATNSISSMMNSKLRMTGMASGLDTETMIKKMMTGDQAKVDKAKQKRELTEWKRDNYREITNLLRGFKDDYFDVLKPSSNMRSANNFKAFTISSTDSAAVTATANSDASAGSHTIKVNSIATAATMQSAGGISKELVGSAAPTYGGTKNFTMTVDGVSKKIAVGNNVSDLQTAINTAFGSNKVKVEELASDGNKLKFTAIGGATKIVVSSGDEDNNALTGLNFASGSSNRISLTTKLKDIEGLDFTSWADGTSTVEGVKLNINGKEFKFSKDISLNNMMSQINGSSDANVNMKYDEINDKFTLTAKQIGSGGTLAISETGSDFLKTMKLNVDSVTGTSAVTLKNYSTEGASKYIGITIDGVTKDIELKENYGTNENLRSAIDQKIRTAFNIAVDDSSLNVSIDGSNKLTISKAGSTIGVGEPVTVSKQNSALSDLGLTANYSSGRDANITLDGQTLVRSTNTIAVNGITYTLNKETASDVTINATQDVDGVYNKIKTFIEKYNEVIDKINDELDEKYNKNYQPLTDEQRESMSDDQIEKWEEKAKTGLLKNDMALSNIVTGMRTALYDQVKDVSGSLTAIGITTGAYYEKGKLVIDEVKLKDAIKNQPDMVMNLFTKESSISYSDTIEDTDKRKQRYQENGLVNRLYDIIQDNIRTTVDKTGQRGVLVQKAGMANHYTDTLNDMENDMDKQDTKIDDLLEKFYDKEDRLYKKFASLETAMQNLNSQQSWLSQQFGGSN